MNNFQQALHQSAIKISHDFRKCESQLIEILQKIDEASVHLTLGVNSLYEYATIYLELSESNAYAFTKVARVSKKVPELKAMIDEGKLTVSKARRIAPILTPENKSAWISKAVNLPKAQLEKEIVNAYPETQKRETVRAISPTRHSLNLSVSSEILENFRRAQNLATQSNRATLSLEETLSALVETYLNCHDPLRKAERRDQKALASMEDQPGTFEKTIPPAMPSERSHDYRGNRKLPARMREAILARDHARCQFKKLDGNICGSERFIEVHHLRARAFGGSHHSSNLITLCSRHHHYQHQFGPGHKLVGDRKLEPRTLARRELAGGGSSLADLSKNPI